jgi:hypothetical protein
MFGLFKSDPLSKLQKQHKELLEKAFVASKTNRKLSDELTAQAAEIELKITALQNQNKS